MTAQPCPPDRAAPLVVAIEGLCYAGKTTLAHTLAGLVRGVVIPDYGELAAPPPFPPRNLNGVAAALQHFLRLERVRTATARVAGTAGAQVVLLDRSPLTLIAHEYGMARLGVPCDPRSAAKIYSTAAEAGEILTPDAYIYLHVPPAVAAARQAIRGPVAVHLMNSNARAGIDHACRSYFAALPPGRYLELDGTSPALRLAAAAAELLPRVPTGPPAPSWRMLAIPAGELERSRT